MRKKPSGKAAIIGTAIAGLMAGYTPQIMDFIEASGLGIPTRRLAQAQDQARLFEEHWGVEPVAKADIEADDGAVVTCATFKDDVVLVTIDPADGKPRFVWVPMEADPGGGSAMLPTALAGVKRERGFRKVRDTRKCGFNKRLNGYIEDVQYVRGDCERRVINAARGTAKRFKIACGVSCPR